MLFNTRRTEKMRDEKRYQKENVMKTSNYFSKIDNTDGKNTMR